MLVAGKSTQQFLKSLGITSSKLRMAHKDLAEEAEQGSFRLWLQRKAKAWGKQGCWGQLQGLHNDTVIGASDKDAQQVNPPVLTSVDI
ncbi:uncharacterized protein AKAME5_001706500 [Lates japonicus]|uniref:Uncharacterized protein n=1 Tax=Lates japonicus TaxID=270547 RepID=A0AAD3REL1_LATJO|nr:uncharacterized protein AKAME5_001706500 [Lates japonicus]